jgi:hypothetical protein
MGMKCAAREWRREYLMAASGLCAQVMEYRETDTFIIKVDESISQMLDDHIVMAQSMAFSPYKKPFEERIAKWEMLLSLVGVGVDPYYYYYCVCERLLAKLHRKAGDAAVTGGCGCRCIYQCMYVCASLAKFIPLLLFYKKTKAAALLNVQQRLLFWRKV